MDMSAMDLLPSGDGRLDPGRLPPRRFPNVFCAACDAGDGADGVDMKSRPREVLQESISAILCPELTGLESPRLLEFWVVLWLILRVN